MTAGPDGSVVIPPCGCLAPGEVDAAICYCAVDDLLRIIRRRYSLAVLNAIQVRGAARYHEIAASLPGVSSSTLAETLRALEAAQLVRRRDLSDGAGPHIEYAATSSGAKLLGRLRALLEEVQDS